VLKPKALDISVPSHADVIVLKRWRDARCVPATWCPRAGRYGAHGPARSWCATWSQPRTLGIPVGTAVAIGWQAYAKTKIAPTEIARAGFLGPGAGSGSVVSSQSKALADRIDGW
jgi:hypothetical protein